MVGQKMSLHKFKLYFLSFILIFIHLLKSLTASFEHLKEKESVCSAVSDVKETFHHIFGLKNWE